MLGGSRGVGLVVGGTIGVSGGVGGVLGSRVVQGELGTGIWNVLNRKSQEPEYFTKYHFC